MSELQEVAKGKVFTGEKMDGAEFRNYVKRQIIIQAREMKKDFVVSTLEGQMQGKAGDYLIIGIKGELYPCRRDIFEETYNWVEE